MTDRQRPQRQRARELAEARLSALQESGLSPDEPAAYQVLLDVAKVMGAPSDLTLTLGRDSSRRSAFKQEHRGNWGEPLDAFRALCIWAEELGADLVEDEVRGKGPGPNLLLGLLASACATASSVWWSLTGGYSSAAESGTRTLFEQAVVVRLFSLHMDNEELIDRYNADLLATGYRDLRHRYEAHEEFGEPPPDPDKLAELEAATKELKDHFGPTRMVGLWWARPVCKAVDMPAVAKQVGLGQYVPFYSLANHSVHADREHLSRRLADDPSGSYWLSGQNSRDAGRPGVVGSRLLGKITADVVGSAVDPNHPDGWTYAIVGNAIAAYSNQVSEMFADADERAFGDSSTLENT